MKKMFTLLVAALGIVSIASAQSRDFGYNKPAYGYSVDAKQSAIKQINREYDYKISLVKMNRRLNGWEKSKQIRNLEMQRDAEIKRVKFSFDDGKIGRRNDHRW